MNIRSSSCFLLLIFSLLCLQQSKACLESFAEYKKNDCGSDWSNRPAVKQLTDGTCLQSLSSTGDWISWMVECVDDKVILTSSPYSQTCKYDSKIEATGRNGIKRIELVADGSCENKDNSVFGVGQNFIAVKVPEPEPEPTTPTPGDASSETDVEAQNDQAGETSSYEQQEQSESENTDASAQKESTAASSSASVSASSSTNTNAVAYTGDEVGEAGMEDEEDSNLTVILTFTAMGVIIFIAIILMCYKKRRVARHVAKHPEGKTPKGKKKKKKKKDIDQSDNQQEISSGVPNYSIDKNGNQYDETYVGADNMVLENVSDSFDEEKVRYNDISQEVIFNQSANNSANNTNNRGSALNNSALPLTATYDITGSHAEAISLSNKQIQKQLRKQQRREQRALAAAQQQNGNQLIPPQNAHSSSQNGSRNSESVLSRSNGSKQSGGSRSKQKSQNR